MTQRNEKAVAKDRENALAEIAKNALIPPVDILEDEHSVILFADLPGVGKDGLDIQIDNQTLYILGKLKTEEKQPARYYSELAEKDYYRAFTIGDEIDRNAITAAMNNGVLRLVLPKSEKVKPKKIDIKVS